DYKVTGVQTCALPISPEHSENHPKRIEPSVMGFGSSTRSMQPCNKNCCEGSRLRRTKRPGCECSSVGQNLFRYGLRSVLAGAVRSEERRVGKEGRARR